MLFESFDFCNWLVEQKQFSNNFARPFRIKRRRPKLKPVPDNSIDNFVKEVDALQKDILAAKNRRPPLEKPSPEKKAKKVDIDDELVKIAKIVLANLKSAPNYYTKRDQVDSLLGNQRQPIAKKVTRKDALRLAKDISFDFDGARFTPEAFRKGIEAELRREAKPSLFSQASHDSKTPDDRSDSDRQRRSSRGYDV